MNEETKQMAMICTAVVLGLAIVISGLLMINRQSNAYWAPIVLACTQNGGTMVSGACYGARR